MKVELSSRMVRSYKGAAASILLLFLIERRTLTQGEMRRGTGYGDEAINDAVWMLREDGLISETSRYTWCLQDGLQQLPLGTPALPEESESYPQPPVDKTGENEPEEKLGPDDPDLALNESMNESDNDSESFIDSFIDSSGSGFSGSVTPASPGVTREALEDFGFYGRGLADLLKIQGLTEGEVRYQVEHAPSLGAALARIKARQPVPRIHERDGPQDDRRKYMKYIEGELGKYVNH